MNCFLFPSFKRQTSKQTIGEEEEEEVEKDGREEKKAKKNQMYMQQNL